jgi:rhodanese-related sulfurtransferase
MGYSSVFSFNGGIPEWRKFRYPITIDKNFAKTKISFLNPEQLLATLNTEKNLYIVDCRPLKMKEFNVFISGAKHHPLMSLHNEYLSIPKDKKIIITDTYMRQAPVAAKFLTIKGFKVIGVLKGGVSRWVKEGFQKDSDESPR